jgi:hypothetical protein
MSCHEAAARSAETTAAIEAASLNAGMTIDVCAVAATCGAVIVMWQSGN